MIRQIISRYRLLEKLGSGSFGAVYRAEDLKMKRQVALKLFIVQSTDTASRRRFLREVELASKLKHQNIATIYDYDETKDGYQFIVMELVEGQTLKDVLHDKQLTVERSVIVITSITEALAEAHRHNIVHRDIKPGNVMIDVNGQVKVLDFGLAKQLRVDAQSGTDNTPAFSQTLTGQGIVMGTPAYMSPEQARGEKVDQRSDLFSVGAVFYECLTGEPPFSGASLREVCQQVIYTDPLPPSRINPQITPELERITLKALAKPVSSRYQTASELLADLRPSRTQRDIAALPSTLITNLSNTEILPQPDVPKAFEPVKTTQVIGTPERDQAQKSNMTNMRRSILLPMTAAFLVVMLILAVWAVWKRVTADRMMIPKTQAAAFWYAKGLSALREGSYFQARKAFEQVIQSENNFAPAHARLGETLMELGSPNEALNQLSIAASLMPPDSEDSLDALYLKALNQTAAIPRQLGEAVKTYQAIAERVSRDDKWAALNDLGRAYEKAEDVKNAISSYRASLSRKSENPLAWLRLGFLLPRELQNDQAFDCFKKAQDIYHSLGNHEGEAETLFQRGVFYSLRGQDEDAKKALQDSLSLTRANDKENKWQEVKTLLQLVALAKADDMQAKADAEQAISLAEGSGLSALATHAHIDLGGIYFDREECSAAVKEFDLALKFAERNQLRYAENRARLQFGAYHVQREASDEAIKFIQPALQFFQANGYRYEELKAYQLLGEVYLLRHQYEAALKEFDQLGNIASQYNFPLSVAEAPLGKGIVLAEQEQYPEAISSLREASAKFEKAKSQSDAEYCQLGLADLLWRLGDVNAGATLQDFAPPPKPDDAADQQTLSIWLAQANVALSKPDFAEAIQLSSEVVKQVKKILQTAQCNDNVMVRLLIEAQFTLGVAQSRSGKAAEGFRLCENASLQASISKDKDRLLIAKANLALAETALANNLPLRAFEAAKAAKTVFAELGLHDSEWRACTLAAEAAQKSGKPNEVPDYINRARELLANLGRDWPNDFSGYLKRADINNFKQRLDKLSPNPQPSNPRSQK